MNDGCLGFPSVIYLKSIPLFPIRIIVIVYMLKSYNLAQTLLQFQILMVE